MINKTLSESIVTVGCDYKCTKGGISTVLESYSKIYSPFYFIASTRCKSLLSNVIDLIKAIFNLLFNCCSSKTRIIHIHTASNNSFKRKSIFVRIAKFMNKKVVLHIHGGGFKEFSEKNNRSVSKIIFKADTIIVLSHFWQEYFKELYPKNNVVIVPNIVDNPIRDCKIEKNNECIHSVFLGLICEAKGIFDLVDTIIEHKEYLNGKFKLHIGGNGDVERLREMINHYGLEDIVYYEGWVDKDRKADLLSKSNIFILPSYIEGVPISILEAMSYGLPIISTNVGGIPEIVENNVNGYLFQPGNKEQMFNCMKAIIENKKNNQIMGQQSLKRVTPHLPQNVAATLVNIYEQLFSTKHYESNL